MKFKHRILCVCTISIIILVLIINECDAARGSSSRKTSSGRKSSSSGSGSSSSGSSGSWWSKTFGGGSSSSSASKPSSSSNTHKKPEPSAPRYEEKKPVGWNVQGSNPGAGSAYSNTHKKPPEPSAPRLDDKKPIGWNVPNNNPGAPPAYSNTNTRGLSNPGVQNAPPYSKNSPPGHQTIQSNYNPSQYQGLNTGQQHSAYPAQSNYNPSQYQGLNYPRNTGQQHSAYPAQSNYNPSQYQGLNYPRNTGPQYSGGSYPGQGGHYPGMNYGGGGGGYYGGGGYGGYSGHNPVQSGYFASGYPITNNYYTKPGGSSNTLTNTLLAGSLGLGLYNALRPYPSYSSGYSGYSGYPGVTYGGVGGNGGGSTVHHHYYNNQTPGANPNPGVDTNSNPALNPVQAPAPAQAVPSNQNTNGLQTPLAPMPQVPLSSNSTSDPANALVPPPPPALVPDDKISDLDCVYAMKILNCTELSQCPQDLIHPSCLKRTITKEYYDSITLPPPPPPPTLAPNDKITDLDCVYAMKILNCSEISQCPQEWMHPSCMNRTITKEYFDSITLPPPPPVPQTQPEPNVDTSGKATLGSVGQNQNVNRDQNVYSSNGQVASSTNSSNSATITDYSLCLTIIFGIVTLSNKF